MITAIVYQSNTGITEKYAMMLAEATLLKVVALSEIKKAIKPKAEIIYLGWLRGGIISGLNKVRNKYQIKVIGAVGLLGDNEEYLEMVKKQNKIYETPLFYLPGGINREKQKGFNKCCLLYTSDAADDLLCVDLGGRRSIKNKTPQHTIIV